MRKTTSKNEPLSHGVSHYVDPAFLDPLFARKVSYEKREPLSKRIG